MKHDERAPNGAGGRRAGSAARGRSALKVAYVVGRFPSLSQTFVLNQITGLIDRGVEVDVYARYRDDGGVRHGAVDSYGLRDRTTYPHPVPASAARRGGRLSLLLARALARSAGSADHLRRLARHGRTDGSRALGFAHLSAGGPRDYDAILCHFGSEGLLGSALRNVRVLRGPLLTAFHGYDLSRTLSEEGAGIYDRLFAEGDLFLPVTEFWRDRLVELGCPAGKIVVHRMGVDTRRFTFAPPTPPGLERVRLLTVCRLVEKKGVAYAIQAVARCAQAGMDVEYSIVGTGPLEPELAALAQSLGVGARVKLLGAKPQEEVSLLLRDCHMLLAPSVTAADGNMEGLPVALMEALATGIPVVSTYHSGIPELVMDGETGLLVPERDADSLALAVQRLVSDAHLYGRVSREGRRRVEHTFEIESLNDRLVQLLKGCTAKVSA